MISAIGLLTEKWGLILISPIYFVFYLSSPLKSYKFLFFFPLVPEEENQDIIFPLHLLQRTPHVSSHQKLNSEGDCVLIMRYVNIHNKEGGRKV